MHALAYWFASPELNTIWIKQVTFVSMASDETKITSTLATFIDLSTIGKPECSCKLPSQKLLILVEHMWTSRSCTVATSGRCTRRKSICFSWWPEMLVSRLFISVKLFLFRRYMFPCSPTAPFALAGSPLILVKCLLIWSSLTFISLHRCAKFDFVDTYIPENKILFEGSLAAFESFVGFPRWRGE